MLHVSILSYLVDGRISAGALPPMYGVGVHKREVLMTDSPPSHLPSYV